MGAYSDADRRLENARVERDKLALAARLAQHVGALHVVCALGEVILEMAHGVEHLRMWCGVQSRSQAPCNIQ